MSRLCTITAPRQPQHSSPPRHTSQRHTSIGDVTNHQFTCKYFKSCQAAAIFPPPPHRVTFQIKSDHVGKQSPLHHMWFDTAAMRARWRMGGSPRPAALPSHASRHAQPWRHSGHARARPDTAASHESRRLHCVVAPSTLSRAAAAGPGHQGIPHSPPPERWETTSLFLFSASSAWEGCQRGHAAGASRMKPGNSFDADALFPKTGKWQTMSRYKHVLPIHRRRCIGDSSME